MLAITNQSGCTQICLLKIQDKPAQTTENTLTQQSSNTLSTKSFVAHTNTNTDYRRRTHQRRHSWSRRKRRLMTRVGSPQRFGLESESHICHAMRLFLFQLYIYLCSGWVMCWAAIRHWSQPRSDRNRTPSLSRHQPLHHPTLHPPLRLMQIVFLWFHFPSLVRYCAIPPLSSAGDRMTGREEKEQIKN